MNRNNMASKYQNNGGGMAIMKMKMAIMACENISRRNGNGSINGII
jgi:hypothetical protein